MYVLRLRRKPSLKPPMKGMPTTARTSKQIGSRYERRRRHLGHRAAALLAAGVRQAPRRSDRWGEGRTRFLGIIHEKFGELNYTPSTSPAPPRPSYRSIQKRRTFSWRILGPSRSRARRISARCPWSTSAGYRARSAAARTPRAARARAAPLSAPRAPARPRDCRSSQRRAPDPTAERQRRWARRPGSAPVCDAPGAARVPLPARARAPPRRSVAPLGAPRTHGDAHEARTAPSTIRTPSKYDGPSSRTHASAHAAARRSTVELFVDLVEIAYSPSSGGWPTAAPPPRRARRGALLPAFMSRSSLNSGAAVGAQRRRRGRRARSRPQRAAANRSGGVVGMARARARARAELVGRGGTGVEKGKAARRGRRRPASATVSAPRLEADDAGAPRAYSRAPALVHPARQVAEPDQ